MSRRATVTSTSADVANGWAAVLQPPGWTPEKTAKLRPLLHASDT